MGMMQRAPSTGLILVQLLLLAVLGCTGQSVVGGGPPRDAGASSRMDAASCPSPLLACGTAGCSDPRTDAFNCGACGRACGTGELCQNSVCVPTCTGTE